MKNYITLFLLLCLFTLLTASKCKKDTYNPYSDNGLPPATQEGRNIFACKVNGQPWISKSNIYAMGGAIIKDTLFVHGRFGQTKDFDAMYLKISGNLKAGNIFRLNNSPNNIVVIDSDQDCQGNLLGYLNRFYGLDGTLRLSKCDSVNKIISGTFTCIIPIPNCDSLHITDGRFDIRFY